MIILDIEDYWLTTLNTSKYKNIYTINKII